MLIFSIFFGIFYICSKIDIAIIQIKNLSFKEPFKSIYSHFDGAFGSEVGFEDFLETFGSVDVHSQGLGFSDDVSLGVNHL